MGLGTINFHGDRGTNSGNAHVAKTRVKLCTSLVALQALATALADYTECNVGRQGFVDFASGNPSAPGASVNTDTRGIIYYQDTTGGVHSITIPGWDKTAHPPVLGDSGDRVAAADVAAIIAAINTATGQSYVGLWGKVITQG